MNLLLSFYFDTSDVNLHSNRYPPGTSVELLPTSDINAPSSWADVRPNIICQLARLIASAEPNTTKVTVPVVALLSEIESTPSMPLRPCKSKWCWFMGGRQFEVIWSHFTHIKGRFEINRKMAELLFHHWAADAADVEGRCCINPAATRADVYAQQLVPQGC